MLPVGGSEEGRSVRRRGGGTGDRGTGLPVGVDEGWSTRGDVDSDVRTVAAITSLSAWPEGFLVDRWTQIRLFIQT